MGGTDVCTYASNLRMDECTYVWMDVYVFFLNI